VTDPLDDLPTDVALLVRGAANVDIDGIDDETDVIHYALHEFFERHDDVRAAATARQYAESERMTLGTAAQLAGVTTGEIERLLRDHDVTPRTGSMPSEAERREEGATARAAFGDADEDADAG
jgi:predicted HTH domain antitoxin